MFGELSLIDDIFSPSWSTNWPTNIKQQTQIGAMDLYETENSFVMEVNAAGVPEDKIELHTDAHRITVRGERNSQNETKNNKFHIKERSSGKFERSVTLPERADMAKVSANFRNGVLRVEIPKQEMKVPKKIDISV